MGNVFRPDLRPVQFARQIKNSSPGFTLIELMIALAVMTAGAVLFMESMTHSNKAAEALNQKVEATNFLASSADRLRGMQNICEALQIKGPIPEESKFCDSSSWDSSQHCTKATCGLGTKDATGQQIPCPDPFNDLPLTNEFRAPASSSIQVAGLNLAIVGAQRATASTPEKPVYIFPLSMRMKRSVEFGGAMAPMALANVEVTLKDATSREIASCKLTSENVINLSKSCEAGQVMTGLKDNVPVCAPEVPCKENEAILQQSGVWRCIASEPTPTPGPGVAPLMSQSVVGGSGYTKETALSSDATLARYVSYEIPQSVLEACEVTDKQYPYCVLQVHAYATGDYLPDFGSNPNSRTFTFSFSTSRHTYYKKGTSLTDPTYPSLWQISIGARNQDVDFVLGDNVIRYQSAASTNDGCKWWNSSDGSSGATDSGSFTLCEKAAAAGGSWDNKVDTGKANLTFDRKDPRTHYFSIKRIQ